MYAFQKKWLGSAAFGDPVQTEDLMITSLQSSKFRPYYYYFIILPKHLNYFMAMVYLFEIKKCINNIKISSPVI